MSYKFQNGRPGDLGEAGGDEDGIADVLGHPYVSLAVGVVWPVSGYVREWEPCHEGGWPFYLFGVIALTNNLGAKEL